MRKISLLLTLIFLITSCSKEVVLDIKSQEDIDKNIANSYIKVSYDYENLDLKNCNDFVFEFKDVEVIKLRKSDFDEISKGLINSKLSSVQTTTGSDFSLEYRGYKFCMNHLGNIIRNNRRMNDDQDLGYLIKSKANYYNHFTEEELVKNDSLVNRLGLPFGYNYIDSLAVSKDVLKKKNIILTY